MDDTREGVEKSPGSPRAPIAHGPRRHRAPRAGASSRGIPSDRLGAPRPRTRHDPVVTAPRPPTTPASRTGGAAGKPTAPPGTSTARIMFGEVPCGRPYPVAEIGRAHV